MTQNKEWKGTWEEAEAKWPGKTAVSKLALILEEGRDPRLVVDASAANLNPASWFPERAEHPTIGHVSTVVSKYYATATEPLQGMTLDVKHLIALRGMFVTKGCCCGLTR